MATDFLLTKQSLPAFVSGCLTAAKLVPSIDSPLPKWSGDCLEVFYSAKQLMHKRIQREGEYFWLDEFLRSSYAQ